MNKEKLKKYAGYIGRYAGYAGLGLVGGYLIGFILEIYLEQPFHTVSFLCGVVGGLGGLLVGVITKKWWWALIGGILSGLIVIIPIWLLGVGIKDALNSMF